jgi:hypothetical protein
MKTNRIQKFVAATVVTCAMILPAAAEEKVPEGMQPLQWKEPRALFIGTPVPIKMDNLEKAGKRRGTVYVPKGVVNVALNKKVTSSDMEPVIGELEMVTDGDITGVDGSYVELGPFEQWIQIDLGAETELHAILFWHFHSAARVYHDVTVQISNDEKFEKGVETLYSNDHDNSLEKGKGEKKAYIETSEGRLVMATGKKARYVRLWSNGNHADEMNHYCEVEVHGKPAK